jgi:hypothetical protein
VTTFVELAKDGAYMAGDRRVHHTERSRWRHADLRRRGGGAPMAPLRRASAGLSAIAVHGLSKRFGDRVAFQDVSSRSVTRRCSASSARTARGRRPWCARRRGIDSAAC